MYGRAGGLGDVDEVDGEGGNIWGWGVCSLMGGKNGRGMEMNGMSDIGGYLGVPQVDDAYKSGLRLPPPAL